MNPKTNATELESDFVQLMCMHRLELYVRVDWNHADSNFSCKHFIPNNLKHHELIGLFVSNCYTHIYSH